MPLGHRAMFTYIVTRTVRPVKISSSRQDRCSCIFNSLQETPLFVFLGSAVNNASPVADRCPLPDYRYRSARRCRSRNRGDPRDPGSRSPQFLSFLVGRDFEVRFSPQELRTRITAFSFRAFAHSEAERHCFSQRLHASQAAMRSARQHCVIDA